MESWCLSYLRDHLPAGPLILDTSVVINLLGTGEATAVLAALGHPCLVEERALREVLRHPMHGCDLTSAMAELQTNGLLKEVRMTPREYELFLQVGLGPGESAAIAIAARGACVVLDDRLARRYARSVANFPLLGSSLTLILTGTFRAGEQIARARKLIEAARMNSRMGVPPEERPVLQHILGMDHKSV
jgi:predicted nucleic acid-binding protein